VLALAELERERRARERAETALAAAQADSEFVALRGGEVHFAHWPVRDVKVEVA
jgi:hypothetical protein